MKVDRITLRQLVKVALTNEDEDRTWVGEFQREDGSNDEELNAWIKKELESGNSWAWCCARVTVRFKGMEAEDYLGGCSYESKEAFMKGMYYEDMINTAVAELAEQLEELGNVHGLWVPDEHDVMTCLFCVVAGHGS
jgi:hypothetical protein